jgi:fructose-bisphosphate aldolase class II
MLASLHDVMGMLEPRKVCLPAFDVGGGQPDFVLAVLRACEAARCPAAMLVWAPAAEAYMDLRTCADMVASLASRSAVPVVLHLDHGRQEAQVTRALEAGFRSVMFDGSGAALDENIQRTREMARLAHDHGASIEGELGRFGQEQGDGVDEGQLTDPDEAARFVRETGVDVLAPAVGNAHGFYKRPPKLRFDLIEQIAAAAGVPLSLHGGTGIPLTDVRRAGELGMRKVNIATQLHRSFSDAMAAADAGDPKRPHSWRRALSAGRVAVGSVVAEYCTTLGAEGLVE